MARSAPFPPLLPQTHTRLLLPSSPPYPRYATEKARRAAAAAIAADVPLAAVDTLRTSLAAVDADGDGKVSVDDLKAALQRAGSTATAKLVAKLLAAQKGAGIEYDTLLGATRRMASIVPTTTAAPAAA